MAQLIRAHRQMLWIRACALDFTPADPSGRGGAFQAIFEPARLAAWIRNGPSGVYQVSTYKQCDDHVTNCVRTPFDQKVLQSFEHHGLTYLAYTRKMGGKHAVHYHLTRRLSKQVLTFKRSEFAYLKAEQDKCEGKPDHTPPLQRTSFNRFATFGTGARNIIQYGEVFKTLVPSEVELLEDDNVPFLLEVECAYTTRLELPFLKGSHQMGIVPSEDYETQYTGYMQAIRRWSNCRTEFFSRFPYLSAHHQI